MWPNLQETADLVTFAEEILYGKLYGTKWPDILTFKRQPHKLVKHTQTIRRLLPTNCLSVFDPLVGLTLKGLKHSLLQKWRKI